MLDLLKLTKPHPAISCSLSLQCIKGLQDSLLDPISKLFPKLRSLKLDICESSSTLLINLAEVFQGLKSLSLSGLKYPGPAHPLQLAQFQSLHSLSISSDLQPSDPPFDCSILCALRLKSLSFSQCQLCNLGPLLNAVPLHHLSLMICRLPVGELFASKTLRTLDLYFLSPSHPPFHASNFSALQSVTIWGLDFDGVVAEEEVLLQKARDMVDWAKKLPLVVEGDELDPFKLSCSQKSAEFYLELVNVLQPLRFVLSTVRCLSCFEWDFRGQFSTSAFFSLFSCVEFLNTLDWKFNRDQEVMVDALEAMPALHTLLYSSAPLPPDTIAALFLAQQSHRPSDLSYSVEAVVDVQGAEEQLSIVQQQWDVMSKNLGPLVVSLSSFD